MANVYLRNMSIIQLNCYGNVKIDINGQLSLQISKRAGGVQNVISKIAAKRLVIIKLLTFSIKGRVQQ